MDFNSISIFLLGLIYGIIFSNELLPIGILIKVSIVFFLLSLFGFGINNVFDAEVDKLAKKSNIYSDGKISQKKGFWIHILIGVVAFLLSILWLDFSSTLMVVFWLLLFYIYSAPPIRLKQRAPFDLIINSVWLPFVFIFSFTLSESLSLVPLSLFISIFLYSCLCNISTLTRDFKADKSKKINSFAVWFGIKKTKILRTLVITALISSYIFFVCKYFLLSVLTYPVWIVGSVYIALFAILSKVRAVKKSSTKRLNNNNFNKICMIISIVLILVLIFIYHDASLIYFLNNTII